MIKKRLTAYSRRRNISAASAVLFLFFQIFKGHTRADSHHRNLNSHYAARLYSAILLILII